MNVRTALVVPCYNEASRLDFAAFARALAQFPGLSLLFVDDGSRDETGSRLSVFAAAHSGRARLLTLQKNCGKAEAVRLGMLAVAADGAEWIGYWDADLATPLEALADYLQVGRDHPEVEMIIGSRVRILGRDIRRQAYRHYFGRVFATAASLTLGLAVYDTQCGAKLFRASPRIAALFERPFVSRWVFDVELLSRYRATRPPNRSIYELALKQWHHKPGSKLHVWDPARAAVDLWRIYRLRVR